MNYVVAKDFNTKSQRLKVGMKLGPNTDFSPFKVEERVDRGFLTREADVVAPAATPAPPVAPSARHLAKAKVETGDETS